MTEMQQGGETTYDVFLSYTHRDQESVRQVAEQLQRAGLTVWYDAQIRPGDNWQTEIFGAIRRSRNIAVFLGPSDMGNWVHPEMETAYNRAVNHQARLIPVLLPGADASDERMPDQLRGLQYCQLTSINESSIDQLIWGITGVNPWKVRAEEHRATLVPSTPADPAAVAVDSIAKRLRTRNVTFFFGSATHPKWNSEIARSLLLELGVFDSGWVPPDLAASYFAVKHGDVTLEDHVIEILTRNSGVRPACYETIAALQAALARRAPIRGKQYYKRLIVTNNLDLLLEKALLQCGVPFTRIVQYRSSNKALINTIHGVSRTANGQVQISGPHGPAGVSDPDDDATLADLIGNCGARSVVVRRGAMVEERGGADVGIKDMVEPIIYKMHGSQDVEKSCTLSTDQYFETLLRSTDEKFVPDELAEIISNTPLVLIGSRILDADFRLSHALLHTSLKSGSESRYAVVPRGVSEGCDWVQKLASAAWDEMSRVALMKHGIQMLDQHDEVFCRMLVNAYNAQQ